ncbi:MAG: hypothetical protein GX117_01185 [Candidatus Hydrogenedentes bacterium]|nr:hypothetical protein [Candidatus Hydrogenedentota bacterium]
MTHHNVKAFLLIGFVLVSSLLAVLPAAAHVYYVKPNGTGDCSSWENAGSLQAAMSRSVAGDEIWVAEGSYVPNTSPALSLKAGVSLYGGFSGTEKGREQRSFASAPTIIDGSGLSGWMIIGADNAVLDGFVIRNGNTLLDGGALYNNGVMDMTLANCIFWDCEAAQKGGAVFNNNAKITLSHCSFFNNKAQSSGGALYCNNTEISISNCVFQENSSTNGGALYVEKSTVLIDHCIFEKNSALDGNGGGAIANYSCSPTLLRSTFRDNFCNNAGGALLNLIASPLVKRCSFEKNHAYEGNELGGEGGAVANFNGTPNFENCIFWKNKSDFIGGAIYNSSTSHQMKHCTLTENEAASQGGAIFNIHASSPKIVNSILYGNSAYEFPEIAQFGNSEVTISFSCIANGLDGEENITDDPLFLDVKEGDLRLQPDSPCIDSATAQPLILVDFRGVPRPQGSAFDRGAYEYAPVETGSLQVLLSPVDAVGDGAGWNIDGTDDWLPSGETVPGLWIGSHTIHFKPLYGWDAPLALVVDIEPDTLRVVDGNDGAYTRVKYELDYSAGLYGHISGSAQQQVEHGNDGEAVFAEADVGFHFASWSDGNTENPRQDLDVTRSLSVTAIFVGNTYELTYRAAKYGFVQGATTQSVSHGSNGESVTAIPNAHCVFVEWSDGRTDNPRTDMNVTASIDVTAVFEQESFTLRYTATTGGSIIGQSEQKVLYGGNGSQVLASNAANYIFQGWSDGRTDNPRRDLNVMNDMHVVAIFVLIGGEGETPSGPLEGDVTPRPGGDGNVNVADWVQAGRFVASLDIVTPGSEFQRLDCAPYSTAGDGKITVADWVQVGRYAAGLNEPQPAAGPTEPQQ